jgi:hypothetical protein
MGIPGRAFARRRRRAPGPGGMASIQAREAMARNACRLAQRLLPTQQPCDAERYRHGRLSRGMSGVSALDTLGTVVQP